ncbi:MAG: ATP-binding protein, partial [Sphingobium sp.]
DSSRNRETGGSGLGLTIAQRLAGRLDGTISLVNRPEGGLAVTITLPMQEDQCSRQ